MKIDIILPLTLVLVIATITTAFGFQFQSSPSSSYYVGTTTTTKSSSSTQLQQTIINLQQQQQKTGCSSIPTRRRALLLKSVAILPFLLLNPTPTSAVVAPKSPTKKRCTDIETCREIGEQKDVADLQANPVTRLPNGVRYKVLQAGVGNDVVQDDSSIDLIYTLSRAGGQYMYSQGFGYEMIDLGNGQLVKDVGGLDSLRVTLGRHQIPIGIEDALRGMKKGERRRVELPPAVGFETSNWEPSPKTIAGKQSIKVYRRILEGFGSQPPFAAPTIWDIEVLRIRN